MLCQEDLYQHILREQWTDILNILYKNKKEIATDAMLKHASTIFTQEFLKKVKEYPLNRKDIEENLDMLYLLNHGKFYILSANDYKTLNLEIVKRKPFDEAIQYARHFPEESICKEIISQFEAQEPLIELTTTKRKRKPIPMNWILIYNRLFELINVQGDKAYFSGPRFLNIIRGFDNYFPDYAQYINNRNSEGKSTTRKIYFYDILMSLPEEKRVEVVKRILSEIAEQVPEKSKAVEQLLNPRLDVKEAESSTQLNTGDPVVFISYSWDDDAHKDWVLNLANRLCADGIDVILDRYYLKPGKNLPHFVENSLAKAHHIIIVFTPNYKLKADKREGGVGYEYSIMNADLYKNQITNEKIIPVLRLGSQNDSIPTFMHQLIHLDLRSDETFENSYTDLLREIYNEPAIKKPTVGTKPIFEKTSSDSVVQPKIGPKLT